ncbi:MAG TPA: hypothetical protein VGF55_31560 [Gemmataceae bacterium]
MPYGIAAGHRVASRGRPVVTLHFDKDLTENGSIEAIGMKAAK